MHQSRPLWRELFPSEAYSQITSHVQRQGSKADTLLSGRYCSGWGANGGIHWGLRMTDDEHSQASTSLHYVMMKTKELTLKQATSEAVETKSRNSRRQDLRNSYDFSSSKPTGDRQHTA